MAVIVRASVQGARFACRAMWVLLVASAAVKGGSVGVVYGSAGILDA